MLSNWPAQVSKKQPEHSPSVAMNSYELQWMNLSELYMSEVDEAIQHRSVWFGICKLVKYHGNPWNTMEYLDVEEPKCTNAQHRVIYPVLPQQWKWNFNRDFCAFPAVCPLVPKRLASHFKTEIQPIPATSYQRKGTATLRPKSHKVPHETLWKLWNTCWF